SIFFLRFSSVLRFLHSFPTRRSSDLLPPGYYPESNHLPLPFFLAVLFNIQYLLQSPGNPLQVFHFLFFTYCRPIIPSILKILARSEEHTSELQSRENLVCRLLLEKKK